MGSAFSKSSHSTNDFELAIKSSKELEWVLEDAFGATGKGLHEKISSAAIVNPDLSQSLVRNMRYLATIRNKLVHERGFDAIPDRKRFIEKFEASQEELKTSIIQFQNRNKKAKTMTAAASENCIVM
ncbi:expressed unknown protein [Seminavis robusta]|uniref:Uncharacterized protein n=1 Tax=Seminavis robusta TaxID=568900 RepID=A0A9N8H559_9STRA|nr:expressed unknown protein [Seminavis robusta]|eukprot:Sro104_g052840.1 n/a (127) ;mRNA; f:59605-59985